MSGGIARRFYAALGPPPEGYPPAGELLARWDEGLDRYTGVDEVILWFEHDLFDQLCLIHHLDPRVKVVVTVLFIVSNVILPDGAWPAFLCWFRRGCRLSSCGRRGGGWQ